MDRFAREVAGALKSAIHAHGPITADDVSSAAKRMDGWLGGSNWGQP